MTRPLRIMIDARMLVGRFGGIARFATSVVDQLANRDDTRVIALCSREPHPPWTDRTDIDVMLTNFDRKDRTPIRRAWWEAVHLPRYVRRAQADLFHATWNSGLSARLPVPSVLTVHDLIPLHDPRAYFSNRRQQACYRYALTSSVRRARKIATVSAFVRDELATRCARDRERIVVVPNGVNAPANVTPPIAQERYVLVVGGHESRKNVGGAIRTMQRFWQRYSADVELRITGDASDLCADSSHCFDKLSNTDRIRFLGQLSDDELASHYAGASALLFLSRDEGFGLPALEAMAYGCPVVAARCASLPEIVGDAGLLVDPDDPDSAADALNSILTDATVRQSCIERGRRIAAAQTWDRAASAYRNLYETALDPSWSDVPMVRSCGVPT